MLILLYYLAGWCEAWTASGNSAVAIDFVLGPQDHDKRAARAMIEGPLRAGQVSVWESGECEISVYDVESAEAVLLESSVVEYAEQLGSILRRAVVECS